MNGIDQEVASGDRAVFWQHPHFRDMGLLKARFRHHRYELHTHPTYVIALITGGCESVRVSCRRVVAPANTVLVVNPEECHDGEAGCEDGWSYRTFYPSIDLMTEVARELGRPRSHSSRPLSSPIQHSPGFWQKPTAAQSATIRKVPKRRCFWRFAT